MSSAGQLSELDLLRGQVADLSRQLAERDRSIQDLRERSQLLRTIVEGTASGTGDEFFASLVRHLTSTLHVQYAVISEVLEVPFRKIRTLAVSAGDTLIDNFEYDLDHTPCATALTQTFACFNRDLQSTFPQFQRLADLGAESYCAVPVRTNDGAVSGLLVVMDTKPLENSDYLQSLLGVFAPRIAAEFERRRAEQEHAMALAEIHNVIETVPDIMFTLDTHGNMVKWNRRVEDVTGYSPEELLNMPALAFVPPEEHIPTAAAIQQAFMEGYAELDGQLLTKDLRTIPYHWTGALLKNSHGEPIGITGIGRDVSGKKRVEEALRESEHRFALAVEGSSDILWDALRLSGEPWYAPQTQIWWSPRVRELLGLQESDSFETFEQWVARLHPDDKDRVFGQLAAHIEQRVPYDVEYRLRTNAGDYRWIRGRGQALWDEQGEPSRMSGSCQDITERKGVEEALRASEERWQLAVRGSNDGIWDWDIRSGTVFFSPRWKAMRGFGEPEITSHVEEWQSRIHPDDLDRVLQSLDAYVAKQAPDFCEEYRTRRKDGSYMWILDRGLALWADDGTPLRMVGSESDITEHKQALLRLVAQESLLRSILDTEPECVNRVADDGTILQMNKAGLCFIESDSFEQVAGRSVYDLVAPEFLEQYRSMHEAVIRGATQQLEFQIVGLKGTRRWMETHAVPLRNPIDHRMEHLAITRDITHRKRTETALRESEERYRTLVDLSPNGVLVYSNGKKVYVNRAACRIMGAASPEQLLENPTFHFSHPDDHASIHDSIAQILATGKLVRRVERKYQRLDGTAIFVEVDAGRIMWNGEPAIQVIFADITDRKQAEEALRGSEERLRLSLEAANQGIYDLNVQSGEALVGSGYATMLDYDPATFHETHAAWIERLHPDDRDRVTEYYRAYVAGTIPEYRVEFRQRTRGGDWRWILSLGRIVERDARGEPLRMLGTHTDITERKQAEEALRASEDRFNLAVRGSNTGIWDWDLRNGKTYFSPLWKSMLGYEDHELRGEFFEWEERLHPDDCERSSATVRAYLEGVTPQYELEHRLRHKDGSYRWILARGVSICDTEGKPYRMAGSHIDITEQKQTQEALAQRERQLQTVLDALPVGVWFTDRAGKTLLANQAAKQIWSNIKQIGLRTENLQAGWWETIGPANEPHRWALSHVLTTGVPSQNETFDFECLDGTKKTIRNSTVPVKNEDGLILGAIVLNEDITALRQAQAALQLTQFSVDHAVEGFLWIGPDARIFDVNDSICRMLEYTWEELTAMTLHDIEPNLTSEVWPAHWKELKEKGSLTFESKYWSRTGRVLDMEVTVNYLQYEGKEYNCAIMRDIGERKRVGAALSQSEERYRSLVDNAPIGIFLNEAGRFVYANREMLRILNATNAEQLIGTPVLDRIAPEFHTLVKDRILELTMGQSVPILDEKFVRLDGSQVDVAVSAIPASLGGNPVIQVLALDITERKQLAEREVAHIRQLTKLYELSLTLSGDPGVVLEHAVRIIGELFNVQVVCLSEIVGQELYFKSVYINGQTFTDAGHCSLAITPCATVEQTKDVRIFDRVMERFPEASFLRDHQAVSYCGFPALDSDGRVVAVTCLLDNKPHEFSKEEQDLLRIFGQRIATEIERSRHTAEQKRAEKELRKSHAFIRQIIDTDPNFIFAKDREGRFTMANKAVADAYGTTVETLIGKTDADFNPNQEEVAFFRQDDLAVIDNLHELFLPEEVITDSDGRTRWLQTVKRPILDDEGCAIMVLGASTDITERKRMEETLRQRERALRMAVEERERISQDLHDGILQSLFAVGLALESAKLTMPPRNFKVSRASLNQAIDQLNDVMREIRNFIAGLGSDLLQGKDLPAALKQMLASLTEHQATRVRLAVEDRAAKALSTEQSLHLIRVIQEAVSNCIKHGHAKEARVSLKMLKRGVRLSVRDNGRGFNQGNAKRTGHGLANMAARARKIGGRFTILSKVNEGTSIVLDFPKEAADVSR